MSTDKPFAAAADRNRHAILRVLQDELHAQDRVLEIGSGTGQHVCHFARALPQVFWQPSDVAAALPGLLAWTGEANCPNMAAPLSLDVAHSPWPTVQATACYTANTLHIMSEPDVRCLFHGCAELLGAMGRLLVYGPFRVDGQPGSPGNAQFDRALRRQDPSMGLRDTRELDRLATVAGFRAARRVAMPANNHLLCFDRVP